VINRLIPGEKIRPANKLIKATEAKFSHMLAYLFSHKAEIVLHKVSFPPESLSQFCVLSGHSNRTGIQVAFAHHHTAQYHQGTGGKAKFLGTQEGSHNHISAGLHLTISLQHYFTSQVIHYQGLLRLCKSDLPG